MAIGPFIGTSGADASGYGVAAPGNYADVFGFDNADDNSTALPQIYEREVTIYGNRTLMGFLRMIGSEEATNSQQVRWAEQKRLHIFDDAATAGNGGTEIALSDATLGFRKNDKVLVGQGNATELMIVSNNAAGTLTVAPYGKAASTITTGTVSILVVGSEFGKGSKSRDEFVQPKYDSYTNSTVIMRDTYGVNGTDANQIGWVESIDENGNSGKYWYLKGKSETMTRWEDYLELSLLEDKKNSYESGSTTVTPDILPSGSGTAKGGDIAGSGSEGLFEAIENRGSVTTQGFGDAGAADFRLSLDQIVKHLDFEGSIEENVFYLNRDESLNFDDGMATQNNGTGGTSSSWGVFNNSENMGLSLGFTSVRRGSYDFYKKDWKYLNALDGRSSFGDIKGISVPMGTKSVYDQYGANLQSPFATINYLAGPTQNRKNISWVHGGSFGGGYTGDDSMRIEMLTERCICVKGANNFFLFK